MTVRILSRQQCGLVPPDLSRLSVRSRSDLFGVTVHCTVTPTADPVATWRQIQTEYMSGQNVNHQRYGDIPYNDAITLAGGILAGRIMGTSARTRCRPTMSRTG